MLGMFRDTIIKEEGCEEKNKNDLSSSFKASKGNTEEGLWWRNLAKPQTAQSYTRFYDSRRQSKRKRTVLRCIV